MLFNVIPTPRYFLTDFRHRYIVVENFQIKQLTDLIMTTLKESLTKQPAVLMTVSKTLQKINFS